MQETLIRTQEVKPSIQLRFISDEKDDKEVGKFQVINHVRGIIIDDEELTYYI